MLDRPGEQDGTLIKWEEESPPGIVYWSAEVHPLMELLVVQWVGGAAFEVTVHDGRWECIYAQDHASDAEAGKALAVRLAREFAESIIEALRNPAE